MAVNNVLNEQFQGFQTLSSAGGVTGRIITGTANQISIVEGAGGGGNPTLSLTSTIYVTGLSFGGTTLSNYATGTFTPTITGSTGNPVNTYTVQVGRYTRIGNRVFFSLNVQISATSGGTGVTQVSGLPFTSNATASNNPQGALRMENTTFQGASKYYMPNIVPSSTVIAFGGVRSANSNITLPIGNISATTIFVISMVYEV